MGKKTRQVLAVTMVAAALCAADKAIVESAPAPRVQVGQFARQFASRITSSFRVTIPAVQLDERRQDDVQPVGIASSIAPSQSAFVHTTQSTPFQFRLPPPTL